MSKYGVTLFFNDQARQTNNNIVQEFEQIMKRAKLRYNIISIRKLETTNAAQLGKILVAAGGDGTVNAVAGLAVKYGCQLAVVPSGTFNHFAKDIGVSLELTEALQAIIDGHKSQVDFGEVNGEVFLNNSVIGFYPHVVVQTERLRERTGKWLGLLISSIQVLSNIKVYHLTMQLDDRTINVKTTLAVIANNEYDFQHFGLASRPGLTDGKLYVYIIKPLNVRNILGVSFRLLIGKLRQTDFASYATEKLKVESVKPKLRVAMDGESKVFSTPLEYKILKKTLTIVH